MPRLKAEPSEHFFDHAAAVVTEAILQLVNILGLALTPERNGAIHRGCLEDGVLHGDDRADLGLEVGAVTLLQVIGLVSGLGHDQGSKPLIVGT